MRSAPESDKSTVDKLIKEFLAESAEGLDRMEQSLTELEARPRDELLLGEIFRSVHTIKGSTGFLGFLRLERLAHAGEHVLGSLRDGNLQISGDLVDGLLRLIDGLRRVLEQIERTGTDKEGDGLGDAGLLADLERLSEREAGTELQSHAEGRSEGASPGLREGSQRSSTGSAEASGSALGGVAGTALALITATEERPEGRGSLEGAAEQSLRIEVEVLNRMMNLVGELVLTRNQMLQGGVHPAAFPALAHRLDTVTTSLREVVMEARLQPVGRLFRKFPRLVRDLAQSCGKRVRIQFKGQTTGLDKSLLEAIKDPLMHMVRNAIDHGIEEPARRVGLGKRVEGWIALEAYHVGGSVVIEVRDDGAGIVRERVLARALASGLVTSERAATMTEREVLNLLFVPGFSLASEVTHVSGRGVGMDIVRANVERVGGTVEIESVAGEGTTMRMRMPLTLAIVPALVVESGGQSFCVPQGLLSELVYVPENERELRVELFGANEVFSLREALVPLVRLSQVLGMATHEAPGEGVGAGFYVAIFELEGYRFGLQFEQIGSPEEIVVKPLSAVLRTIGLFSGGTVLGSGTLALILDIPAIAMRANVRSTGMREPVATPAHMAEPSARASYLVFEGRMEGAAGRRRPERLALPLPVLERIETVERERFERVAGRWLLRYQGELLMVEDAGGVLDQTDAEPGERLEAGLGAGSLLDQSLEAEIELLICRRLPERKATDAAEGARLAPGRRIGLAVRRVVDIADGILLRADAELCPEPLVLVGDQLAALEPGFSMLHLREDV